MYILSKTNILSKKFFFQLSFATNNEQPYISTFWNMKMAEFFIASNNQMASRWS